MVLRIEGQEVEARELGQGEAKGPGGVFTEPVEEPPVGLGDDGQGGQPAARRSGEQADELRVIPVRAVEEADEGPAVDEHGPRRHGRRRP
jgi:hypothetical protein